MKKNLSKLTFLIFLALIVVSPAGVFAQGITCENLPPGTPGCEQPPSGSVCTGDGIGNLLCQVHRILNSVIPVLIALGVVYFVWGVVRYVIADGEEAKKKGKDSIIYGIIGLAIISSLWGIVNIVVNTFDLGGASAPTLTPLTTGTSSTCSLAGNPRFQDLLCYITRIINDSVIPLMFAIATAFFVWGAIKFLIIGANDEKNREQGKQFMIWGIIALTVMLGVWGLVAILGDTFGLNTSVLPQVKQ